MDYKKAIINMVENINNETILHKIYTFIKAWGY